MIDGAVVAKGDYELPAEEVLGKVWQVGKRKFGRFVSPGRDRCRPGLLTGPLTCGYPFPRAG